MTSIGRPTKVDHAGLVTTANARVTGANITPRIILDNL